MGKTSHRMSWRAVANSHKRPGMDTLALMDRAPAKRGSAGDWASRGVKAQGRRKGELIQGTVRHFRLRQWPRSWDMTQGSARHWNNKSVPQPEATARAPTLRPTTTPKCRPTPPPSVLSPGLPVWLHDCRYSFTKHWQVGMFLFFPHGSGKPTHGAPIRAPVLHGFAFSLLVPRYCPCRMTGFRPWQLLTLASHLGQWQPQTEKQTISWATWLKMRFRAHLIHPHPPTLGGFHPLKLP